jgi:CBS domain containing-hemolysin-like protein
MEPGNSLGALALFSLLVVSAVLSMAHAALVNVSKPRLRELIDSGNRRAIYALRIAEDATRLLASYQLATILLRFIAASILTLTIASSEVRLLVEANLELEAARWLGYGSAIVIGALLMALFGEMIPATIASSRPDSLALILARPMGLLMDLLSPVSRVLLWISNRVSRLFGAKGNTPYVTEAEIKTLVDAGSEGGALEDEEKEMIYSIFQFGDTIAREIMVPRIDIVALSSDATIEEALDTILSQGHSRIPIYDNSIDSIIGLLYAKDLLHVWQSKTEHTKKVRDIIRPAYFVPEAIKAGTLLEDIQQRKIHMAIVVDEYGGTAGLVTIEDLVEEIVGDIQDEYDPDEEAEYTQLSETVYLFDAGINLGEVNKLLDVELPTEESDTLGGYVFSVLGKVPLAGETFREGDLEIRVEMITGRRIRKVLVTRLAPETAADRAEKAEKADRAEKAEKNGENSDASYDDLDALAASAETAAAAPDGLRDAVAAKPAEDPVIAPATTGPADAPPVLEKPAPPDPSS